VERRCEGLRSPLRGRVLRAARRAGVNS
jgi:hypothetical protein